MTAKEAITWLSQLSAGIEWEVDMHYAAAIDMAIEALKAQEKTDTISRQAAIGAICKACSMEEDYHKCDGYPETSTWCDELVALRALPSAQPEITDTQAIEQLQASGWMQNHDKKMYEAGLKKHLADDSDSYDALLPSAQPDAVTASLEELIDDYGEDGFFIVDGVNYQASELLNELKTNSSVGEKFRKQITKTIVQYFMKFGAGD